MGEDAIFRDTTKENLGSDRSAGDRQRHREKVRKHIKGNVADYIAEESIIGKSKDKIIKVPIRGIKEYRFIYGSNNRGLGQGDGESKPGDVIGKQPKSGEGKEKAGDQPGVDYYETEITLEDLMSIVFEDLELPEMEKKALRFIESERQSKRKGYRHKGIRIHLDKKRTVKEHKRRELSSGFHRFSLNFPEYVTEDEYHDFLDQYADDPVATRQLESFYYPDAARPGFRILRYPLDNDDLRYHHMEPDIKIESNAVVFCIMDSSGSMDTMKKYLARTFFFLLYQWVTTKYRSVEVVFVAHHTEGRKVNEEEFFTKGESGGTFISSGYETALQIIEDQYDPSLWNIYAFHCSDGDNFESDDGRAIGAAKELCKVANLFGYGEIKPEGSRYYEGSMIKKFKEGLKEMKNYDAFSIGKKEDLWPAFKKFLSRERVKE